MIHPHTQLRFVSPAIGYGMFATRPLPAGTITYVRDPFELTFTQAEFAAIDEPYKSVVDRYCYTTADGTLVMPWDMAKYVNHHCEANTLLTALGFDIAVRDIAEGEEITNDYGLFNVQETLPLGCGCAHCRHWLQPDDLERLHAVWDAKIAAAFVHTGQVEQALLPFMDGATRARLDSCLSGLCALPSVMQLQWTGAGTDGA